MRKELAIAGAAAGAAGLLYWLANQEVPLDMKLAYVNKFAPIDLEISRREGWLPGILTGWSAMESKWGTSELAQPAPIGGNNVFGVKAGPTWQKLGRPFIVKVTKEYQGTPREETRTAAFRSYSSWRDSAEDLVRLLKIESVYRGALDSLERKDVAGFLAGIEASGYSTAKDYGSRILNFTKDVARIA
jgi:flagellar protein FlgJ